MLLAGKIMIGGSGAAFYSCSANRGVETAGSFFAELDESVVRLTVHSEPFRCLSNFSLLILYWVEGMECPRNRHKADDSCRLDGMPASDRGKRSNDHGTSDLKNCIPTQSHTEQIYRADQLALRASFSVSTLDDAALRARNSDADAG